MQILYKLKTAKVFETVSESVCVKDEDPFVIQFIRFCSETQQLCVAGTSHVLIFTFSKQDSAIECPVVEVTLATDVSNNDETDGGDSDAFTPSSSVKTEPHQRLLQPHIVSPSISSSTSSRTDLNHPASVSSDRVRYLSPVSLSPLYPHLYSSFGT